ncbi:MAG TPA: methyltransferase domain-containing protein [Polyangia bacterium]|nr:methyltransferase domain-containing protein [Polyangia bacterium]
MAFAARGPLSERVVCPQCGGRLDAASVCTSCGQVYPQLASARVLLPNPAAHVEHWRKQLGLIVHQGRETTRALEAQAAEADTGAATATRLRALARSVADQVADLAALLGPALGGPLPPDENAGLPRGATDYITCLFRDWAWADGADPENERSLTAVQKVSGGRALGRTLVLGAGGCRLAYDLHTRAGGSETAALDIDPYLLVVAEAVVRGARVSLTEASVNAPEIDPVGRRWTLSAPAGALAPDAFHFFLAKGTEPPFAPETFDTVVTPWFIDQVPTDLPALLRRIFALLAPGGRWINHGPLIYRPDMLPIARWYARQEIFDLAAALGFSVESWETVAQPHFVSPLTGRGLIESVLTFAARRL